MTRTAEGERRGELRSLQELSAALSTSHRFDQIAAEVAHYAMHALDAAGAAVLLATQDGSAFEVVAAKGSLASALGHRIDPEAGGLALDAIRHERLEIARGESLELFPGAQARGGAAAPLRAHGETFGAIAVVDHAGGDFTGDDGRLLDTAAAYAAVVLSNARFFELTRLGKEQWEATFDALAEGIALVDRAGAIRRANAAIAGMLRARIAVVIGRHLGEQLFGEKGPVDALLLAAEHEGQAAPIVVRSKKLNRTVRLRVAPLARPTADASAVIVVEDITEQTALEHQLMQSEKLAAVGTLVSGVAHELNNPLTSIAGLAEFLLEQAGEKHPLAEHLHVINDQAERASHIVRNLLSFARKGQLESAPLDVGEVVQRTVSVMSYELRRAGIEIVERVSPSLPPVMGNRDQIQQIVLNLITNAAYALARLPDGVPRRLTITVDSQDDQVRAIVADTGPGMGPDVAAHVFDPFYTTKPPGEGTGLGLFLSFGIAESHGGSLTVESQPGKGAAFTLSLPRTTQALAAGARRSVPAASAASAAKSRRILVVDDDPALRRLVGVLFRHDGHVVDESEGGPEALRLARENDYDLVITDRRAAAGAEPFGVALGRARPGWQARTIVTAAERASTQTGDWAASMRLLRKPFNLKDLRAAAADVWGAGGPAA